MNKLFSRLAPAVALCLPLLALAQADRADPSTNLKAASPALGYQSAFSDYKAWQDVLPGDWRGANDNVRDTTARSGGPAVPGPTAPAASGPPLKAASAPVAPGHDGHQMHGGKP